MKLISLLPGTPSDPFWNVTVPPNPICDVEHWGRVHSYVELCVQPLVKRVSLIILDEFKHANN